MSGIAGDGPRLAPGGIVRASDFQPAGVSLVEHRRVKAELNAALTQLNRVTKAYAELAERYADLVTQVMHASEGEGSN